MVIRRLKKLLTRKPVDEPVARVVLTSPVESLEDLLEKIERAGKALRGRVAILQTWGGCITTHKDLSSLSCGPRGTQEDFDSAVALAAHALEPEILQHSVMRGLEESIDYCTLGIDVWDESAGDGSDSTTKHAELVATIDIKNRSVLAWTGKSQPTASQQRKLIHCRDLSSHFQRIAGRMTLVLGCHDLNIFSNRSRASTKRGSEKAKVIEQMQALCARHKPEVVLAHPHTTDTWKVWSVALSGTQEHIPSADLISIGINHESPWADEEQRAPLDETLARTKFGRVTDIIIP